MKSKQSLFLMSARILSAIVTFVSVRFFIRWFGLEQYGAYSIGQNMFTFAGLIDPGVFVGAARRMTEAFHHGNADEGWRIHRTQMGLGIVIGLLGIVGFAIFGTIYPLPMFSRTNGILFMTLMGVQFSASWMLQYVAAALAARDKFSLQATTTFLSTFGGAVTALILGYTQRSMLMVAAGYGFGTLGGLMLGLLWIKFRDPDFRLRVGFESAIAKDLIHQGFTNYPNRVAGTFSNRADKPIIGVRFPALSGIYGNIGRPAEILTDLIGGAVETTQPDITRSVQVGSEEASQKLHRNSLVIWSMACCLMMVPCAFGDKLLKLWLPDVLFPTGGIVMICVAINYAGELHYRALGTIYVARGTLYRSVWFPAVNGIATVLLTMPVVTHFGLLGIGLMNAGFSLVQLYPRILHVLPETEGHFPVGRHFSRSAGILLVSGAFCGLGYGLCQWISSPWLILLAPIFAACALLSCLGLKLAPAPRFMARFGFQIH